MENFLEFLFKIKPVILTAAKAKEIAEAKEKEQLIELKKREYENIVRMINYAILNGSFEIENVLNKKCLDILPAFEKLGYKVEVIHKNEFEQDDFPAIKITWK